MQGWSQYFWSYARPSKGYINVAIRIKDRESLTLCATTTSNEFSSKPCVEGSTWMSNVLDLNLSCLDVNNFCATSKSLVAVVV